MRIVSRLAILLAFCLVAFSGSAQTPVLSIAQNGVWVDNDSVYVQIGMDSIVNFEVKVVNEGPGTYSGPLKIGSYYQEKFYYDLLFADSSVSNMAVGDTVVIAHRDTVTQTSFKYKGGGNVVIVWPYAAAGEFATGDSGNVNVWVDGTINVDDPVGIKDRVSIYPNPTQTRLNFRYEGYVNQLEYVRIFDIQGREHYYNSNPVTEINVSELPKGIYFVRISYKDGLRGTYRLIVTD